MAVRYAVATGNWSAVGTWDGGASLPGVGDDVYANGYTVTVNQNITVAKISTEVCPTTSVGGGLFQPNITPCTLTGNLVAGISVCVSTLTTDLKLTIVGNIYGGNSAGAYGLYLNCTVYGGPNGAAPTIIGNVYGGSATNCDGIKSRTDRTYSPTITGNIYAGLVSAGVNITNAYTIVTGNIYANAGGYGFYGGGTLYATGNIEASANYAGAHAGLYYLYGNMKNNNGILAIVLGAGSKVFIQTGGSLSWQFDVGNASISTLYTADVLENPPAITNVRTGIVYGIGDAYTGTCAVPPAESVVKNVPVDNAVGTWAFDSELITRLQQCSTVPITGQQIASHNGAPAELVPTYEKRYDLVGSTMYLGAAPVGTLDASTVWTLTKIVLAIDGSITSETHATDSWDNHLTATYV